MIILNQKHYAYILRCSDSSLYCGYSTNPIKRTQTHNSGKGAKYTRSRLPVSLVYIEEFETKSEALKQEARLKKYTHKQKEEIIESNANNIKNIITLYT